MNILSKYEGYEPKTNIDMSDIPYANMVMGIVENETINTIQREFGGTDSDTPFVMWSRVYDAAKFHSDNFMNRVVN
jgi:hypothetical protein